MLRTLISTRKNELMGQARAALGESVEMIEVRSMMLEDGLEYFSILASDGEAPPPDQEVLRRWGYRTGDCTFAPEREDLVRRPGRAEPITIAFVGPPGAGKTTTMAKLALNRRLFGREDLRVAFACLDTYRAGALEQLRLYAELAGAEFEAVYSVEDATRLRRAENPPDVLLVDAPGRAWHQEGDLQNVRGLLEALAPHEIHLVLPAGLRPEIARSWVQRYRRMHITHLLPTKVDECPDDWAAFDIAAAQRLPIRWIGEGQDIPNDVRSAQSRLARAVLGHATRVRGLER